LRRETLHLQCAGQRAALVVVLRKRRRKHDGHRVADDAVQCRVANAMAIILSR
jgi:hypothetical protein